VYFYAILPFFHSLFPSQTLVYIALSFGLSLLVNAWVFYRITGGVFNPAITLALFLCGGLSVLRAVLLTISQILGGIAAAALLAALTPFEGAALVLTTLGKNTNVAQGLFIEAFLTAVLVLTVLFLAVEKHKGTYLAPIGIGLTLFSCHLFGVVWTGCGINPARAFGPSVIQGTFVSSEYVNSREIILIKLFSTFSLATIGSTG
jgi:aquaporin related protein